MWNLLLLNKVSYKKYCYAIYIFPKYKAWLIYVYNGILQLIQKKHTIKHNYTIIIMPQKILS